MTYQATNIANSFYELTARQRIEDLVDKDSFYEFIGPEQKEISPHLQLFDLPEQFDDGIIAGKAQLNGKDIYIAAQEGRFMGGAIGEVHGAKLLGMVKAAHKQKRDLILLLDTGGVRLQEANAGEIAIAEIMRAIIAARLDGVSIIAAIGGRSGCYGGGSLIAASCSKIIMSEHARLSVSGPEVIETNKGVEEFDSRDRALIWRTMGGKHRYIMLDADCFVADDVGAFRQAIVQALKDDKIFDMLALSLQQNRLASRLLQFAHCQDALDIWQEIGIENPVEIPNLSAENYLMIVEALRQKLQDNAQALAKIALPLRTEQFPDNLQQIANNLFGENHTLALYGDIIIGHAEMNHKKMHIFGIANGASLTIDYACVLAQLIIAAIEADKNCGIVLLIDSASQNMSKRDELLGLNHYLAQLAKTLFMAKAKGHATIAILYGHSAAGAFIASALATEVLIALPMAYPAVMDLPSMARVTKLSVEKLQEMAKATPVFAPGLDNLFQTGGVFDVWENTPTMIEKLSALAEKLPKVPEKDQRAEIGLARKGRVKTLLISEKMQNLAENQ